MTKAEKDEAIRRVNNAAQLNDQNTHCAKINADKNKNVWWVEIPLLKIEGGSEEINVLLFDDRSNELHHLRIPIEFLQDNMRDNKLVRLRVRDEKHAIKLELATDQSKLFQDASGVQFAQFKVRTIRW